MLRKIKILEEYNTDQDNLIESFYRPCLAETEKYDRSVGFFRSSVFLLVGPDLVRFAQRGGIVRLVCSPHLTDADVEAMSQGYDQRRERINAAMAQEIDSLMSDSNLRKNTEALATLIAHGAIEVKIVFRPGASGEFHSKLGLFYQGDDIVCFKGSVNESWTGWHERGNHETLDVFCSWNGGGDATRARNSKRYFQRLWQNEIGGLEVEDFPAVARERLNIMSKSSLTEIEPDDLSDYFDTRKKSLIENRTEAPVITPFRHQTAALVGWKHQGSRGIFEHATGSGKTITAILAINEFLVDGGVALILVPDKLLHAQWCEEIKTFIPEATLLRVGAGHTKWKKHSNLATMSSALPGLASRIIIATMQTARTEIFLHGLSQGQHLMIVADEVHEIGSRENSKCLCIESGPRLGLSATPKRYGDVIGTTKIFDYFGPVVEPRYTLIDAINDGRLVQYEYFPRPVNLTAEESDKWAVETKEISKLFARSNKDEHGNSQVSSYLQMLIINRARIAKKATRKIRLAVDVLQKHYQNGQSWLVYCEDTDQLTEVMNALKQEGIECLQYHSNMESDQKASLDYFKDLGGILCAIACLDQGVDIPQISHALILASSQNPRQFIQRRGRVLRTCSNKHKAVIFDAVVVPVSLELEPEQLSLLKSEFQRCIEFAKTALNRSAANEILGIANEMGIDLAEFDLNTSDGIEENV